MKAILKGGRLLILCECGEFVEEDSIFVDYIKTSANPSSRTVGHQKCGIIFNFIDEKPKIYSSRKKLKSIAALFAEKKNLDGGTVGKFLLEVDRLKSCGKFSDYEILCLAFMRLNCNSDTTIKNQIHVYGGKKCLNI